ncbi:MAG: hypothetical protein MK209_09920 [Planctomycetes bacterium]|nr:hypothetical protein [Planctomycetota bacterium]
MADTESCAGWLTAYEPFLGRSANQSQEVVRLAVADAYFPQSWGHSFWPAILPELLERTEEVLARRPRVWLAVGEAREEGVPQLEVVARNHWDLLGDAVAASGGSEKGVFEPGGPSEVRAHWPANQLARYLSEEGFSVELSDDAGSHCCNGVLWWASRMAAVEGNPRPWMGFLHLPRQVDRRTEQAALIVSAVRWLNSQFAGDSNG